MYVLSHGSGLYYIIVHYCMVYSIIAPSRSNDAIMQCDGAIWCKDVMVRWRDGAMTRHGGCSSAWVMVRWRNDDDAMVRQLWWLWCNDVVVWWRWRDSAMTMTWWCDAWVAMSMERWHEDRKSDVLYVIILVIRRTIVLYRHFWTCAVYNRMAPGS